MSGELAQAIANLAAVPSDRLDGFVQALKRASSASPVPTFDRIIEVLPEEWRQLGRQVFAIQREDYAPIDCCWLATAIEAAALSRLEALGRQEIELVWSGPSHVESPFRRTDRAWIDLIDEAKEEIWIASYSVGAVARIQEALTSALKRSVRINFVFERKQDSDGAIQFNGFESFAPNILASSSLYIWPREKRDMDSRGRPGLMHAKAIVVDGTVMFVTSANLSNAALERSIEVGVVVRGGPHPKWLAERFERLIEDKAICELKP